MSTRILIFATFVVFGTTTYTLKASSSSVVVTPGGGLGGGVGGPPLPAIVLYQVRRESCNDFKKGIFAFAIKVSRNVRNPDSLLAALKAPHEPCAYDVRLWLYSVEVQALIESERYEDASEVAMWLLSNHIWAMRPGDIALVQYYRGQTLWYTENYRAAGQWMALARAYYEAQPDSLADPLRRANIYTGIGYARRESLDSLGALCAWGHALRTVSLGGDYLNMRRVRESILDGMRSVQWNVNLHALCRGPDVRRPTRNDDGRTKGDSLLIICSIIMLALFVFFISWTRKKPTVS